MVRPEVFEAVIGHLERHSLPYFVTGSIASSYYGEPRMTQDADIALDIVVGDAKLMCREMAALGYYADDQMGADAVHHGGQFNIVDPRTGFKMDLMVVGDEGFDGLRMTRRRRGRIAGLEVWVSAPEDVILRKLLSYQEGGSDKHLRDIAGMFKASGDLIDREYAEHWAMRLGVSKLWRYVLDQVPPQRPGIAE